MTRTKDKTSPRKRDVATWLLILVAAGGYAPLRILAARASAPHASHLAHAMAGAGTLAVGGVMFVAVVLLAIRFSLSIVDEQLERCAPPNPTAHADREAEPSLR